MPATKVGTHGIEALLAARFTSAARFGLNNIAEILQRDLEVHNTLMIQMLGEMCDTSADRLRIYGSSDSGQMIEVDEFGRGPTQKPAVGTTVAFPLKLFQYNLGWTRKWLQNHTAADMAIAQQSAQKAHRRKVYTEIKRALFLSGNYTWTDMLQDNIQLPVKRLLNADGAPIPEGPNGEIFIAGTHTHYLAATPLTAAFLTSVINTVVEHGNGGQVRLYINAGDEAAVRALTGFTAYLDPRITLNIAANQATQRLDITRLDNRPIGIFGAAEVWVKPWMIQSYAFAFDVSTPQKPLVMRTRTGAATEGLAIAAELDAFPLHAQFMEAEFGIGVWNRTNGAVGYFGGGAFVDPTITG